MLDLNKSRYASLEYYGWGRYGRDNKTQFISNKFGGLVPFIRKGNPPSKEIVIPNMERSLGFTRVLLPQIAEKNLPDFLNNWLPSQGIQYFKSHMKPSSLYPAQGEFNMEKVRYMIKNPETVYKKPLIVSNDDYILDGHHRWVAAENINPNTSIKTIVVNKPILQLLSLTKQYQKAINKTVNEGL